MAIAGWDRNINPNGLAAPFASSTVCRADGPRRRATVTPASSRPSAVSNSLNARIDHLTQQVQSLADWRAAFNAAVPSETVAPVDTADVEIPAVWDNICSAFPYVLSDRSKCHKVTVGYPAHPSTWRTQCGWPFGLAEVATPAQSLPACHKSICERCCKLEKAAVKASAESRVREVGGVAPPFV